MYNMSAGLIPSTDSFATGDPQSAFFLRPGQPIAAPSPLQLVSANGDGVVSMGVSNTGALTVTSTGSAPSVTIAEDVSTFALSATSVTSATIDADIVSRRILFFSSGAGGGFTITQDVPGMTGSGAVLVQQISSGAVIAPVVAQCLAGSVVLTSNAELPANADYWVYVLTFI
jgi:hypothetical protein